METQTKVNIGLVLMIIAGFSYVGVSGQEASHYCESREIKAYCYNLSSTAKTCYTLPARQGGKRCTEGWKEIPEIYKITAPESISIPSVLGARVVCDKNECLKD